MDKPNRPDHGNKDRRPGGPRQPKRPFASGPRPSGDRPSFGDRGPRPSGDRPSYGDRGPRPSGDRPSYGDRGPRPSGDRPSFGDRGPRPSGDRPSYGDRGPRPSGDRPSYGDRGPRPSGDRPSYGDRGPRPSGDRPSYGDRGPRPSGDRPSYGDRGPRPSGDRPSYGDRGPRPSGDRPSYGDREPRPSSDRPSYGDRGPRPSGDRPSYSDRGPRPSGDRPSYGDRGPRPSGDRPSYGDRKPRPVSDRPLYGERKPRPVNDRPSLDDRKSLFGEDQPEFKPASKFRSPPPVPTFVRKVEQAQPAEPEEMVVPTEPVAPVEPVEAESGSPDRLEGRNPIHEALKAGRAINKIWIAKREGKPEPLLARLISQARDAGAVIMEVDRRVLDQMSETHAHQGIIAQVAAHEYVDLETLIAQVRERGEVPFLVLLDELQESYNLGSILRIADAAGVHGVIIPERRSVGLDSAVAKASAGAIEHVPVARVGNLAQTVLSLKEQGFWITGTDSEGTVDYRAADWAGPMAIVVGSEGEGIGQQMRKHCDFLVSIPMHGKVNSLNAAVAAGIVIFEAAAHRAVK